MFRTFLLPLTVLAFTPILFAGALTDISVKKSFNFNLKDSQVWSAELQKVDVTRMNVDSRHEIAMMQFQSADGAFQIHCMKMLKGFDPAINLAACHIQTDESMSQLGTTSFQNLNNNQIQKIEFSDPRDLQKLNLLVSDEARELYKTTQIVAVSANGQSIPVPKLTAACPSLDTCLVTIAESLTTNPK